MKIIEYLKKWFFNKLDDPMDYHLEPEIKRVDEMYHLFLSKAFTLQKWLLPRKIKYFYKHDKFFFIRLLLRFLRRILKIVVILIFLGLIGIFVAMFGFGVKFHLKAEPIKKETRILFIQVDDTTDLSFYKANLLSKNNIKIEFAVRYVNLPTKTYEKWANDLYGLESKDWVNPYEARRKDKNGNWSQYWGKYQFGTEARKACKMEKFTWDEWRKNPQLQEGALRIWVGVLYKDLEPDIKRYNDKFLNGWHVTTSGLIAMAHNVGQGEARKFLYSGGKYIPHDGSGIDATRFLILGGYNLGIE